jgi:lantibiotic modifying enzyme
VAGAYYLAALVPTEPGRANCGLYTGLAGQAFVLDRVAATTGEAPLRQAAERCRELIRADAKPAGAGVEWSEVTDVVYGSSGTGLYLLHHARSTGDTAARDLAVRAGQRLVELALPEHGGSKWRMDPEFARLMPNFSHGTSGVAYFLATLFRDTGRRELLDAALAGGRYLQAIATTTGDSCLIFHHEPEGKDLYYLGWCHGPAGTARLFYQLHRATDDKLWLDWMGRSAQGVMSAGIPEQRTPGFWNNAGMCCGTAGVADFFLHLHTATGEERYLAFARRMTADLLKHATATPEGGLKWIHAEHRIRPEYTYAQTGYMQGAAGIGTLLLHMAAKEAGKPWTLRLPDVPY